MSGFRIEGSSGTTVDSNASGQIKVVPETDITTNPNNVGAVKFVSENDAGLYSGDAYLASTETDDDYRLRISADTILDFETFNYGAQNTGKHTYTTTTMAMSWSSAGLTTNSGSITTANTGTQFGTWAEFPILGATNTYLEFEGSLSNTITTNFVIDFGFFRRGASYPFAPTDGVYFRVNSAGILGVINYNGSETTTSAFTFVPIANKKYQFIISITERDVEFWIDNNLAGSIDTPTGQGQPFISATLPISIRHANIGIAGAVIQFVLNDYSLSLGGAPFYRSIAELGNASLGSYQGLSGGTMGSIIGGTVTTGTLINPTAAVPSNTALTTNLPLGLGGRSWESFTAGLALNTDGIIMSYQVPAGSTSVQGKRLKVTAVKMTGYIQTALTGGGIVSEFTLCFGHTAVSLQTTETSAAKAPRRVLLPEFTQYTTTGQAISTVVSQPGGSVAAFDQPIYVNAGEFISIAVKHLGTLPTAGTIARNIQFVYSWE